MRRFENPTRWRVGALAPDPVVVAASPSPQTLFYASPSVAVLPSGRLLASHDLYGPGMAEFAGNPVGERRIGGGVQGVQGRVYASDDGGATWSLKHTFPMCHSRLIVDGKRVYVLGHTGQIRIMRSDDGGESWSDCRIIGEGADWTCAPCNVWVDGGHIYLVMMKLCTTDYAGYFISRLAPCVLRAKTGADLLRTENWTFSEIPPQFCDLVSEDEMDLHGFPFYPTNRERRIVTLMGDRRRASDRLGWHEAHVVRVVDPDHYWHDAAGKTLHVIARCETHRTGFAAMLRFEERDDGSIGWDFERTPAGKRLFFLNLPGGQMKFHLLYDDVSRLYWLLSTQATDSMTRFERLPEGRFELPYNQRDRLALHFSRNLVDWCFAGLVDQGGATNESRHYAGMAIAGNDLVILSRSGSGANPNPHDCDQITFHRVDSFRELVY